MFYHKLWVVTVDFAHILVDIHINLIEMTFTHSTRFLSFFIGLLSSWTSMYQHDTKCFIRISFADILHTGARCANVSDIKNLFSFLSLLVCVLNFHQNWISRIFTIKFKTGFSDSMFQMSSHWILYSTKLQKWNDVMRTHWFYYNVFISKLKESHISRVSILTWSQSTQW